MKNKPILHLNLKKKWFDMILSGEKKEEYRDYKDYWKKYFLYMPSNKTNKIRIKNNYYNPNEIIICFSNGYKKDRPQIFIECLDMFYGQGKPEWGAEKNKLYFIFKLGNLIGLP